VAYQEFQYIQDILKEFYAPAIVNQVYKKAPFWAQIKKRSKGVTGKRVYIPVQTAFTEAVGSRESNDYGLPTSQKNSYDSTYIYMKRNYGRIQVDGFAIESAKGKGGWVDILSNESKGVSSAFAIEIDRQMVIDVHDKWADASHTEYLTSLTINSISGAVLTLSGDAGGVAAGDLITRENVLGAGVQDNIGDMMGLDGIISATNYPTSYAGTALFQGIASTSDATWDAYVMQQLRYYLKMLFRWDSILLKKEQMRNLLT